jgi:hypothetical protein
MGDETESGTMQDCLAELRELAEQPSRPDRPPHLRPQDIRTAPLVFQPRGLIDGQEHDLGHVKELVRVLRAAKGTDSPALDPLVVTAFGPHFYCIDGHHRLEAYREAGVASPVPVQHFEGSLKDAIWEAIRSNAKDKLPMTKADKLEAAWRLTCLGKGSKREVSAVTSIGTTTIAEMRRVRERLVAEGVEPLGLSWWGARGTDGPADFDETHVEAMAREYARRLGRTFGKQFGKHPDIAARAIELFSPRLPKKLIEQWIEEAQEAVAEFERDDF